jgi:hypothetical protein
MGRQRPDFAAMIGWQDAPAPFGDTLHSVWSLHHAHGRLHAGTKPAEFLTSTDGGVTWEANAALAEFPDREDWSPGAAGLTLHTLVSDPDDPSKFWLAISAAGVFATEDGAARAGSGAIACRMPRPAAITITPPHRGMARPVIACTTWSAPAQPRRVRNALSAEPPRHMAQPRWRAHLGRYRRGLPSTFGFPIAVHPHDPDTIWVVPLNGDSAGTLPAGRLRGGLGVERRRRNLVRPAQRIAHEELLLHRAQAGDDD